MSNHLANPQSVSAHMAKGNTAAIGRMKALLKDFAPKQNHHFCPPVTGATLPGTSAMARARAAI
jgi:hypothetical protein